MKKILQKGFTLIELLIVIGIIGILAAVVLIGIDPVDKINAANDSKVQRDVNALANAMESYAATHDGIYPTTQAVMVTNGDLKTTITAPGGYTAYTVTIGPPARVAGQLKSKRYVNAVPTTPAWVWCDSSGKAAATASTTTCP